MKLSEKIGYGFGDMSSSMFWKLFSYFLPFFYSNVFGLSLADAGMLMLITRLWDAVSDPMMGILADRTPAFLRNSNGRLDLPGPTQEAS